jgi:methyl-accepting chemotaxis protein/hemerythrin
MQANKELIKWSKELSVDLNEIDDQHKKLLDILNSLFNSMQSGSSSGIIKNLIKELYDYAKYHFDNEEKYFDKFSYEEKESHIKLHEEFKSKINELDKKIDSGNNSVSSELLNYLINWITGHINVIDKKYVPLFKENGIK